MNEEKELKDKIEDLEKDNKVLALNLESQIKDTTEKIEENIKLTQENKQLKEENQNLQKQIKEIESDAIKLMDKMLELQLSNTNELKCQTEVDKLEQF